MKTIDLLIIKYLSKNGSFQEQTELLEWLEKEEANRVYFRSLKDTYDLQQIESDTKEAQLQSQWTQFSRTTTKPIRKAAFFAFMRYAAIFIVGALTSYFIYSLPNQLEDELLMAKTKIETGIGERSKVTLPDGSTVWINGCSSITFDNTFGDHERAVKLDGEAYFDVKTDSLKPFLVHTDQLTYRVTGTSFNVYSFGNEDETSIALLKGGVIIEYGATKEKLFPGELFIYNKTTGANERKMADVNHISSWRHGEFTFDNLTFDELTKRLERMFDVQFVFENKQIRQEQFGGTLFDRYSLETILKVIKTSIPINYKINENTIFIY